MKQILFFLLISACATHALENSNSSHSSSPRSPRSPREELGIVNNVERIQDRDKKGRIVREFYSAKLQGNILISVDAIFDKKNNSSYLGFWRRGEGIPVTMSPECAQSYFEKLKIAYLQNNQSL